MKFLFFVSIFGGVCSYDIYYTHTIYIWGVGRMALKPSAIQSVTPPPSSMPTRHGEHVGLEGVQPALAASLDSQGTTVPLRCRFDMVPRLGPGQAGQARATYPRGSPGGGCREGARLQTGPNLASGSPWAGFGGCAGFRLRGGSPITIGARQVPYRAARLQSDLSKWTVSITAKDFTHHLWEIVSFNLSRAHFHLSIFSAWQLSVSARSHAAPFHSNGFCHFCRMKKRCRR